MGDGSGHDRKEEALLVEYSELRQEVRLFMELQHKRATGGITALGAVIGYALLSENGLVYISLSPIIIALLFILTTKTANEVAYLGSHLHDIEQSIYDSRRGWEDKYGGVVENDKAVSSDVHPWLQWNRIPELSVHLIVSATYFVMIGISLWIIHSKEMTTVFGLDPFYLVLGCYAVVTLLAAGTVFSHLKVNEHLGDETPDAETDATEEPEGPNHREDDNSTEEEPE